MRAVRAVSRRDELLRVATAYLAGNALEAALTPFDHQTRDQSQDGGTVEDGGA